MNKIPITEFSMQTLLTPSLPQKIKCPGHSTIQPPAAAAAAATATTMTTTTSCQHFFMSKQSLCHLVTDQTRLPELQPMFTTVSHYYYGAANPTPGSAVCDKSCPT